jgi:tetratricopeptide (TPR) repeat protein
MNVNSKIQSDQASVVFKIKSLIRSKNFDQAKVEINNITDENLKPELWGLFYTKKNEPLKANAFLKKAYEIRPLDRIALQLSQNFLKLKLNDKALHWSGKILKPSVASKILKSEALSLLGKVDESIEALKLDQKKSSTKSRSDYISSSSPDLEKQKYKILFSASRIKSLFLHVDLYLKRHPKQTEPAVFAIYILKEKDRFLAGRLFDQVLSANPKSASILKEMGVFELENKNMFLAAHYFKRAAALDPLYAFEASMTLLQLGHHAESHFYARQIKDSKKRTKQKFFILVDQQRFSEALAMKTELKINESFEDEKIIYSYLYAAYKLRAFSDFVDVFSSYRVTSSLSKVLRLKVELEKCKRSLEVSCFIS